MSAWLRTLLLGAWFTCALAWSQPAAGPSEVLRLQGSALRAPVALTAADLAGQPADLIAVFTQTRGVPGAELRSTVRGVRLARLVERSLADNARANWKNLLVTVTATDGYRAQFTWVELTNTAGGDGVLLLFERDGAPLDAREGRIALLATGDLRLGARHVRNAVRIDVRALSD